MTQAKILTAEEFEETLNDVAIENSLCRMEEDELDHLFCTGIALLNGRARVWFLNVVLSEMNRRVESDQSKEPGTIRVPFDWHSSEYCDLALATATWSYGRLTEAQAKFVDALAQTALSCCTSRLRIYAENE